MSNIIIEWVISQGRKRPLPLKKMAHIREIMAKNLRENRRKCGFSQEKLAEKAGISTHYLAMMEIARNFPTSEINVNKLSPQQLDLWLW